MIALPAPRREHALVALIALFAGLAAWPWLVRPSVPERPPATAAAASPTLAALPPPAGFSAIVDRPLFSPTRRPDAAAPAPAAPAATGIETRYRLIGVIGIGADRRALVADGARRIELREGERLDAWTVTRVAPDRLVLTSPAGETTLKLAAPAAPPKP